MLQKLKYLQFRKPDFIGISASFLCMVHCAAYPIIVSLGVFVRTSSDSPRYFGTKYQHFHSGWNWLDYLFVGMAIWAVFNAAKNTHSDFIKIGLWASLTVFSFSILLHHQYEGMFFISLSASFMLVIFHILNLKSYKICDLDSK